MRSASKRIELDLPLNPYDRSTFYGFDVRGYTDYPEYEVHESEEGLPRLNGRKEVLPRSVLFGRRDLRSEL